MGYDSLFFYFVFYSNVSNSQIVQKLCSISDYSLSSEIVDQFREQFSCILNYHDIFGIAKKNLVIVNKPITVLFGSFSEDLFLYNVFDSFLGDKFTYGSYTDSDCYLSVDHRKYSFANKFLAFAYNPTNCDIPDILSTLSKAVIDNDFSAFTTPFHGEQEFLANLVKKIESIPVPEKDLKICIEYFNLSSLLSIKFFQTTGDTYYNVPPDVISSFEPLTSFLVDFGIISSDQYLEEFYSFDLKTQISLLTDWQSKFSSSISDVYSWDELFLIVSFICSFNGFKKKFFHSKSNENDKSRINDLFEKETRFSQKDRVFLDKISSKKYDEYVNFIPTFISDNFQSLLIFFDYSNNLINDFISKSKDLMPKGFEIVLENVTNQLIDNYNGRYVLTSITNPVNLMLATLLEGVPLPLEHYEPNYLVNILKLIPKNVFDNLDNNFIVLQSTEEPRVLWSFNKFNSISLINFQGLHSLNVLLDIEGFLFDQMWY